MREVGEVLGTWNGFYVMMGSAAAALTGLMFVVITLVRNSGTSREGIATFSTPTVAHFCCALFVAAFMSAPFRSIAPVAILLSVAGLVGVIYVARISLQARTLERYRPDLEDWTWHMVLPSIAYVALIAGGIGLFAEHERALFAPAAAVTLLIFVGIHNAWDVVTYIAIDCGPPSEG